MNSKYHSRRLIRHSETRLQRKIQRALFWSVLLVLAFAAFVAFTGCSTSGKFVRPIVDVPQVSTNSAGIVVTNVVSVVAPEWMSTLDAVESTGELVPPPYGTWISLGATGIASLLGLWARSRQKSAEDVARTVIAGIEASGGMTVGVSQGFVKTDEVLPAIKESVRRISLQNGTSSEVHKFVKQVTK